MGCCTPAVSLRTLCSSDCAAVRVRHVGNLHVLMAILVVDVFGRLSAGRQEGQVLGPAYLPLRWWLRGNHRPDAFMHGEAPRVPAGNVHGDREASTRKWHKPRAAPAVGSKEEVARGSDATAAAQRLLEDVDAKLDDTYRRPVQGCVLRVNELRRGIGRVAQPARGADEVAAGSAPQNGGVAGAAADAVGIRAQACNALCITYSER